MIDKSSVLVILHKERDIDYFRIHNWFTPPME